MLVFDQLKKDDPQLRFLATVVLGGILILLSGLWWIQVVSSRHYQTNLEKQSIRSIQTPPVRGRILDRDGRPLAENRPSYNVDLYLEALSKNFQAAYATALHHAQTNINLRVAAKEKQLGHNLTALEKKPFLLTQALRDQLQQQTRYEVVSNLVANLSANLQQPVVLTEKDFQSHYQKARALPMTILPNLNPMQVARFEEQSAAEPGMDLEVLSTRYYPGGTVAAHLIGYLAHNNNADDDDSTGERKFSYRLPDFTGVSGVEKLFDSELHGTAGEKSVLVNYLGYRQSETVWAPTEPGQNVVLTIDLDIQKAADKALLETHPDARGAVIVMDVRNGDVLAMATGPTFNPNHFIQRPAPEIWSKEWERWTNEDLQLQMNHAVQGEYAPGSIFKIVVGLAALELNAVDPKASFHSLGYYILPGRKKPIGDTAGPGEFDFDRALAKSSNPYFITQGLKPGVLPKMVALGRRLHFGERTGLLPHQEDRGYFPTPDDIAGSSWRLGNTANLSIGQDKIAVTPLQIAVMISAVANGGTVFWPRLVSQIKNSASDRDTQTFPSGRIRDTMGVSERSLRIVHQAMLADVESSEGTGHEAAVPGMHIAGKTGTAEVEVMGSANEKAHIDRHWKITWFASFAPAENPRYAVVAMVVGGASGGLTCAPLAHKVYVAIQDKEKKAAAKSGILAETR